jgi:putative acetyltransferase
VTNPVLIALESADQPEVSALIDALDAYQKPLYPPASHHGIDLAALMAPDVLFAVARDADGAALGCGALVMSPEYGELKRMVTQPTHRRSGVARSLLQFLENEAQARGCRHFVLETGVRQLEALSFYERQGYARCAPFGNYIDDPHSVFMRKTVPPAPRGQS